MFPFVFSPIKIAEGIGPTGDRVCVALYGNPIPYPDLTLTFAHIITLSLTLILNTSDTFNPQVQVTREKGKVLK
jgi:hypothetical protein